MYPETSEILWYPNFETLKPRLQSDLRYWGVRLMLLGNRSNIVKCWTVARKRIVKELSFEAENGRRQLQTSRWIGPSVYIALLTLPVIRSTTTQ
ncbi:hypothetical protein EVAR_30316_1 [Eumeta japonica]|uniref:Uncharacterized protein n=1 Tax=Eumeta variegata TaxID=151549 RepID=A0A4C1WAS7_EUMVA|nr:hypothetical protein EVAR_30316_1 [Eumeta japonica]